MTPAAPAVGAPAPVKSQVSSACDAVPMLTPRYRWRYPDRTRPDAAFLAAVEAHGGSSLVATVLARRGVVADELDAYFGPPALGLHDAALLPDAAVVVERRAYREQAAFDAGKGRGRRRRLDAVRRLPNGTTVGRGHSRRLDAVRLLQNTSWRAVGRVSPSLVGCTVADGLQDCSETTTNADQRR